MKIQTAVTMVILAKVMAYMGMHETDRATSALSSACYLGDREACLKINELDPSDCRLIEEKDTVPPVFFDYSGRNRGADPG